MLLHYWQVITLLTFIKLRTETLCYWQLFHQSLQVRVSFDCCKHDWMCCGNAEKLLLNLLWFWDLFCQFPVGIPKNCDLTRILWWFVVIVAAIFFVVKENCSWWKSLNMSEIVKMHDRKTLDGLINGSHYIIGCYKPSVLSLYHLTPI